MLRLIHKWAEAHQTMVHHADCCCVSMDQQQQHHLLQQRRDHNLQVEKAWLKDDRQALMLLMELELAATDK